MTTFILVHFFICVFLVFVILLQPGKGDAGIGFGSSSSQSIFGSRGAGNFLTKTTSICAVLFLLTSFFLTRSRLKEFSSSVISATPQSSNPAPTTPATPGNTPASGDEGSAPNPAAGAKAPEPAKADGAKK